MMLLSCVLITVVTLILVLNPLGVHDVAITAYGGIVVVAALLLTRRNFYAVTALTLAAAGAAFALDITGHTHSEVARHSSWPQFAAFLLVIGVFAVIGRVASEVLFGSLGAARVAAAGDPLTGFANRAGFLAQAAILLAAQRGKPGSTPLILADIDGFRRLRVVAGYAAADRVVLEVARRVAAVAGPHLVARIAEDEFAVLAVGPADDAAVARLARELHDALAFELSGATVRCAVGYARFPRDGDRVEALLLAAESSLLSAKGEQGGASLAGPADRI